MNRYPLWKNLLIAGIVLAGVILALPTFFGDDPALHVTRTDGAPVNQQTLTELRAVFEQANIPYMSMEIDDGAATVRFDNVNDQLRANLVAGGALEDHVAALTLAPRMPSWLDWLGLRPMSLGLDLRGGVHFLYQVDLDTAIQQFLGTYESDLRARLREARIRGVPRVEGDTLLVGLTEADAGQVDAVERLIRSLDEGGLLGNRLLIERAQVDGRPGFRVRLTETALRERQDFAIQQNMTTLRNRVDELGVSEAVVQRQGLNRILVQLPGVQDPAQAKRVLGSTASLEFRLVDYEADPFDAQRRGRAPLGSELFFDRAGAPVVLRREVIASGAQLTDASSGYEQGQPAVFVRLNAQAARRMLETTAANLGRPMAVLFIEEKPEFVERNGEEVLESRSERTVINVATIQGVFSNSFRITGLTPFEAQDLALQLRAGALAAPIVPVEERTIGPSLGQDNIERGRQAVIVGFLLCVGFLAIYYGKFGLIANLALFANLILLIAMMSLLGAALTLPGIAGIVLGVGMAVDANVLIYERIREELKNGSSVQASISAGFDKAFTTILDSNLTTLIAALVLFAYGTGPIKGFAITLALGLATSMFTAILGARAIINWRYGGRQQIDRLPIGI